MGTKDLDDEFARFQAELFEAEIAAKQEAAAEAVRGGLADRSCAAQLFHQLLPSLCRACCSSCFRLHCSQKMS